MALRCNLFIAAASLSTLAPWAQAAAGLEALPPTNPPLLPKVNQLPVVVTRRLTAKATFVSVLSIGRPTLYARPSINDHFESTRNHLSTRASKVLPWSRPNFPLRLRIAETREISVRPLRIRSSRKTSRNIHWLAPVCAEFVLTGFATQLIVLFVPGIRL